MDGWIIIIWIIDTSSFQKISEKSSPTMSTLSFETLPSHTNEWQRRERNKAKGQRLVFQKLTFTFHQTVPFYSGSSLRRCAWLAWTLDLETTRRGHCSNLFHHLSLETGVQHLGRWRQERCSSALQLKASSEDSVSTSVAALGDEDVKMCTEVLICTGLNKQQHHVFPLAWF